MYKILIVDDEFWMCKGLEQVISRHCPDFIVEQCARNGIEALRYLENQKFQIVITDIQMHGQDGLELVKEMRKRNMLQPVIIITGHSKFEYAKTALRYGVKDYLLKPLNKDEVKEALERLKMEEFEKGRDSVDNEMINLDNSFSGHELITLILQQVITSFAQDLSLSSIANATGYNSSYLSRLFKKETGIGFVKYVNELRMKEAQKLLRQTSIPIVHIATRVGFGDEKYFSRFFKQEMGKSPTEYRLQKT